MNPSGSTSLICLLGSPVSHSISPAMHNTAFDALKLNYSYMAFDVDKANLFIWQEDQKNINDLQKHLIHIIDRSFLHNRTASASLPKKRFLRQE